MRKVWLPVLCFALIVFLGGVIQPSSSFAASTYSNGTVNDRHGEADKDLTYEDFQITDNGFLMVYIVNTSLRPRTGVKVDVWTTNPQETRIFWRKSVTIGEMAPHARFLIKERYPETNEDTRRTKFMARIPTDANFRNKAQ